MNNTFNLLLVFCLFLASCGTDCSEGKDVGFYNSGYEEGVGIAYVSSTLDEKVKSCEEWYEQLGKSTPNDCFCAGFNDGLEGNDKRN
jgi:hypothetical protein